MQHPRPRQELGKYGVYHIYKSRNRRTFEGYHWRFVNEGHHEGLLVIHDWYQTKMPEFQETYMVYRKCCLILNDLI